MTILEQMLEGMGSIAILGRIRPDGDCLGSAPGLYNYLRLDCSDTRAAVYLEEASGKFDHLKGFDETRHRMDGENYELCVCLDCGNVDQLGEFSSLLAQTKKSLCLDHHVTNTHFAGSNLVVPETSSTCEVLYGQLDEEKIDIRMAEYLYTGIIRNTGVFRHSYILGTAMEIAGKLMAKGIGFGSVISNNFHKKTHIQNQILGRALLESITFFDGKCIFNTIRRNEMEFYGVDSRDMDGIIDQLRLADDVEVAIPLYQTGVQEYKVNMRSQNLVDVSRIAAFSGGGGYMQAAGHIMTGSIHDVVNNLSGHIVKQLEPEAADRA